MNSRFQLLAQANADLGRFVAPNTAEERCLYRKAFCLASPPSSFILHPSSFSSRGSVLIVVLVVCLGLVSMTLVFNQAMLMSYRGADNAVAGRQAEAAVLAGEQYAESIVANANPANVMPDRTNYLNTAVPVGDEAFFWFIGRPLASDPPNLPAFALVDEASKLNLNAAATTMLALLPNMTLDYAQAIRSWRSTQGTTTDINITMNAVKSAPFESPEELALVNGGTDPSALYGDDYNLNHCLDPEEGSAGTAPPAGGATAATTGGGLGQFNPGLLEYVTVFSREPNTMADGTKRANVLAGVNGLRTALTTALSSSTTGSSTASSGSSSAGSTRVNAILSQFVNGRGARFASVVDFCQQAGLTPDEWDKVTPYLTMGTGTYTVGLVNVNSASAAVLACLPSMTDALAAKLVTARAAQSTPSTNLAWIVPVLGETVAASAGRWLTTRSYQFSADVAAVGRHGRGYRRTLFVIDTSQVALNGGAPQIVYRRDLSGLGWALGADARATLASAQKGVLP